MKSEEPLLECPKGQIPYFPIHPSPLFTLYSLLFTLHQLFTFPTDNAPKIGSTTTINGMIYDGVSATL